MLKFFHTGIILKPEVIKMTIYDRIRTLRIEKGLTQEDAAKALGYNNRSTISRIEKGEVDLPQKKIIAFVRSI